MNRNALRAGLLLALLTPLCALAQDAARVEIAGPIAESTAAAPLRELLAGTGLRVTLHGKTTAELWLVKEIPEASGDLGKLGVVYPFLSEGAFVGVVRLPERWLDFRGKPVAPGTYTLRYSVQPIDGNHSGVSDFRDYVVLIPAEADPGERVIADPKALLALGRKGSGTNHPPVMSLVPPPKEVQPPSVVSGPRETLTLVAAAGSRTLALVVAGQVEGDGQ